MNFELWRVACRMCKAPMVAQVPDYGFSLTVYSQCGSRHLTSLFPNDIGADIDLAVLSFVTFSYTLDAAFVLDNAPSDIEHGVGTHDRLMASGLANEINSNVARSSAIGGPICL